MMKKAKIKIPPLPQISEPVPNPPLGSYLTAIKNTLKTRAKNKGFPTAKKKENHHTKSTKRIGYTTPNKHKT
ncbi:MAG: hypothetical protein Q6352_004490 [Candidatus Freyrarchaeum guaymaensis]